MKTLNIDTGQKIAVTADLHWRHRNIVQYCKRPWLTPEERATVDAGEKIKVSERSFQAHNDGIIAGLRSVVGCADLLFIIGDCCPTNIGHVEEFRRQLPTVDVHIILGNHDDSGELDGNTGAATAGTMERVFGAARVHERLCVNVGGQEAVLDHYPGDSWYQSHKGVWLLFGHAHGTSNARRDACPAYSMSLDVGVDCHGYRPWLWKEELVPYFAARRERWQEWRDRVYGADERSHYEQGDGK